MDCLRKARIVCMLPLLIIEIGRKVQRHAACHYRDSTDEAKYGSVIVRASASDGPKSI